MGWKNWALEEIRKADLYNRGIGKDLEKLINVFDKQDHSRSSANWVADLFYRLVRWKPLSPLTNNPDEWVKIIGKNGKSLYQSRRCPSLFATESQLRENKAEDMDYYYKVDDQGNTYQDGDCGKVVDLPYMPPTKPELLKEVR